MVEGSVFDEKDVVKRIELEVGINKTIYKLVKGRLMILSYTKGLSYVTIVLCEIYIGEKGISLLLPLDSKLHVSA